MIFLRERPPRAALAGVLLAAAGVAVLALVGGGDVTILGDSLVLLNAIAEASAAVLTVCLVRHMRPVVLATVAVREPLTANAVVATGLILAGLVTYTVFQDQSDDQPEEQTGLEPCQ